MQRTVVAQHQELDDASNSYWLWQRSVQERLVTCCDAHGDKDAIELKVNKVKVSQLFYSKCIQTMDDTVQVFDIKFYMISRLINW